MKKIITFLGLMALLFGSFAFVGVQAKGISGENLPPGVLMKETNPKSLLYGHGTVGLQVNFLQNGAYKANIYQLILKKNNEYTYGLVGDIQLGRGLLQDMTTEILPFTIFNLSKKEENKYLMMIMQYLIDYVEKRGKDVYFVDAFNQAMPKVEIEKFWNDREKTYVGTVRYEIMKQGVAYRGYIHFRVYNDKYNGPSFRFVEISDYGQSLWWPSIKGLLTSEGF